MLGCAKAEHLSVHWLREVLHLYHHGLLRNGAALHPHQWFKPLTGIFPWGNELDLLASSHLGTGLGLLELKAQASSLEAKLEEPSWQLLGQWLPPLLPASLTDGRLSFPFLGKQPSIRSCTDILQP